MYPQAGEKVSKRTYHLKDFVMDAKSLAKTCLRLMAIYTLWNALVYVPALIISLLTGTSESGDSGIIVVIVVATIPFAFAASLWIFADSIANCVIRDVSSEAKSAIQTQDIHAIVLSTAGLIMLLWTLPVLLSYSWHNLTLDTDNRAIRIGFDQFLSPLLRVLLGVSLAFGTSFWTRLINHFKNFGLNNK